MPVSAAGEPAEGGDPRRREGATGSRAKAPARDRRAPGDRLRFRRRDRRQRAAAPAGIPAGARRGRCRARARRTTSPAISATTMSGCSRRWRATAACAMDAIGASPRSSRARAIEAAGDAARPVRCCFPAPPTFIRAAAAAVPIAIASGALRHEIDEIIEAAGLRDLFTTIVASGDTPREQAVAGAVPAGVRAARSRRPAPRSTRGAVSRSRIRGGGSNRHAEPGYAVSA